MSYNPWRAAHGMPIYWPIATASGGVPSSIRDGSFICKEDPFTMEDEENESLSQIEAIASNAGVQIPVPIAVGPCLPIVLCVVMRKQLYQLLLFFHLLLA